MKMYLIIATFVQCVLLSQVNGKCTDEQNKQIQDCRGGGQFYYIYNQAETAGGLADMLLLNVTEKEYSLHCEMLTEYTTCISKAKLPSECHTLLQTDTTFEGVFAYYKYVCAKARSYTDYAAAVECREAISRLEDVQKCDKEVQKLNLVPGHFEGVCGNITSWLDCYTRATGTQCNKSPDRKEAVYVMNSQYRLVGKMAEAAKCQGQDFLKHSKKYSETKSSGSGWIHAVWISLLVICIVTGVLIYIVYKKRINTIPRQRLHNEIA